MWWFCHHTLYRLSTHVIVSFSSFHPMLVGFFYVCSSMTLYPIIRSHVVYSNKVIDLFQLKFMCVCYDKLESLPGKDST